MFISVALLTLGSIVIIAVRDWLKTRRFSSKLNQKTLRRMTQAISLQEWDKAQKILSVLQQTDKSGKEAALFEVQVLRGTGRLEEALHKAQTANKLYSEELLFYLEEGHILLAMGQSADALKAFQTCSPILRGESDLFAFATALRQTGHVHESLEMIKPFLQTTHNGHILQLAADACYELKFFSEAIQMYRRAVELGRKTHHLFTQLGHAYRRLGNLAEAEKIFRELLEKDSQDVDALLGLGACLQERGHHQKALLVYQSGLATQDLRLVHQAAFAALRTKKYSFAAHYFLEVMKQQENDPQTMALYGLCLENQKKWQEAEQIYLKMIQLFPTDLQGYRALAWMFGVGLSRILSQKQGMHYAHVALKLKNDTLSWEILSACMARIGQFDQAYQIQLALAKQDDNPKARIRRQQALRSLRKKIPLGDHQVIRSMVA